MGSETLTVTDDDGPRPHRPGRPVGGWTSEPTVLVQPPTVSATRSALEAMAAQPEPRGVVGFADLTAPNLVDLLDDLLDGPGGAHLRAIAVPWPAAGAGWLDDVAVRRGLACLQSRGLALRLLGRGGHELPSALARIEPALEVAVDRQR
jgi:L-fuconolactonase